MKLKYQFAVREVAGSIVAMALGADSREFNGMIKLNSVAKFIFEQLKEDTTVEKIVENLTNSYEVSEEEAKKATENFLNELRKAKLLTE